ncbi:MAG TPA: peptide-methionine (S)-S-oxide reductase MsrA [Candidatus Sulfotelmatobacter sp.]|nr:peptide-methionine (S)-S-oxide reductase MsrA [Candidatus Sulfotelmatobacter sp.]
MSEKQIEKQYGGRLEVAAFANGCFWCTEAVFKIVKGVEQVESGYTGGSKPNPTYEEVSSGRTGHVEAVQIKFDPAVISFREILEIFFATHDPTTLNRQGPDIGTQYNSVIFYENEMQKTVALALIDELNKEGVWDKPIITKVVPATTFYRAEEYHKDYYARHRDSAYCQQVITPKILKLQQRYFSKLKPVV